MKSFLPSASLFRLYGLHRQGWSIICGAIIKNSGLFAEDLENQKIHEQFQQFLQINGG
jgi:hypothetical protein